MRLQQREHLWETLSQCGRLKEPVDLSKRLWQLLQEFRCYPPFTAKLERLQRDVRDVGLAEVTAAKYNQMFQLGRERDSNG